MQSTILIHILAFYATLGNKAVVGQHQLDRRRAISEPSVIDPNKKLNPRRCPRPYVWARPSWWKKYKTNLTTKVLKRCAFLKGTAPAAGTICPAFREGTVCLLGEAICNNVVEPETRCDCTNGIWKCFTICSKPKCPTILQSGATCDSSSNRIICKYDEHCCGDTCEFTKVCRCGSSSSSTTWECVFKEIPICNQTSLEEVGCPCDRPVGGEFCTSDYSCGSGCCGQKSYTCKCNSTTSVYENCSKPTEIPKPLEQCDCVNDFGTSETIDVSSRIQLAPSLSHSFPANNDLGIRFNKVKLNITLGPNDFPITRVTADVLRDSNGASVVERDCFECTPDVMLADLIQIVGGLPTNPSRNSSSPYWQDLKEVVIAQRQREKNIDPHMIMPLPKAWWNYTIADVAEAVHDEFPGIHHVTLIQQLMKEGAKIDRSIMPSKSKKEFIRSAVMLAEMNTWAIGTVAPLNFGAKWYAGRARPEEVLWKIAQRELTAEDGCPQELVDEVLSFNMSGPTACTAYPEGSPTHPSWPAMHSAASSSAMWIPVVLNLTESQWCETMKMDWGVAYARTVAGVHYPTDNIDGLNMGQEILARKLPGHLKERYGSDPEAVSAKIATLRFDWKLFMESDCAKSSPKQWTPLPS